ncbi:MAG: hypothetical protein ABSA49_18575 [Rhizomicrobium sp.]|jgi:hypothetical protein
MSTSKVSDVFAVKKTDLHKLTAAPQPGSNHLTQVETICGCTPHNTCYCIAPTQ